MKTLMFTQKIECFIEFSLKIKNFKTTIFLDLNEKNQLFQKITNFCYKKYYIILRNRYRCQFIFSS